MIVLYDCAMIADPEDVLILLVALAPFVLLIVWLMGPKSKIRIGFLALSLLLFFLFLPVTTLSIGVLLATFLPGVTTSPAIGSAASVVLTVAPVVCLLLASLLLYRARQKKSDK